MTDAAHATVLLEEAIEALVTDEDGCYVDGTFGRGGHSGRLLERLTPEGRLLAIDRDAQAVAEARARFAGDQRLEIVQEGFAQLAGLVEARGWLGKVSGVLLDLGVSSPQLDQPERGFSFLHDGPLDMRMDQTRGISAADWVNSAPEGEIVRVLKEYGEERFARRMARAIVGARQERAINRTGQLAEIVKQANPAWEKGKHPATRAFQAIRIEVNNELEQLQQVLVQAVAVLAPGGRLVVISFHSLEDRIVKRFIRRQVEGDQLPRGLPIPDHQRNRRLRSLGKATKPGPEEVRRNPRARSAVMRVAEKLA